VDNSKCVILTPVAHHIEPDCDKALRELEKRGYQVWRVWGYSAIDQGRCQMATDALREGFDELMWIDADTGFDPDVIDRLRSHDLPIVCGICAKKNQRAIAAYVLPETEQLVFGEGGGLVELFYGGTGFLYTRREVYERIQKLQNLPICNVWEGQGKPTIPYFLPMIVPWRGGQWYLAEDFAFFERARRAGFKIMADTTIRLKHFGNYGFQWEDAGLEVPRYATFNLNIAR
jgi:hypothetical protein